MTSAEWLSKNKPKVYFGRKTKNADKPRFQVQAIQRLFNLGFFPQALLIGAQALLV